MVFKIQDLVVPIVIAFACIYSIASGQESKRCGAIFVGLICICLFYILRWRSYKSILHRMQTTLGRLVDRETTFVFTDDLITVSSLTDNTVFRWIDIKKVWSTSWLVIMHLTDGHYVIIPLLEIDEDVRSFILNRTESKI